MIRFLALTLALSALAAAPAAAMDPALSPAANTKFLADFAAKHGAVTRPSGLEYRIIHNGFGKRPGPRDVVTVNYKGSLINGRVFDQTEPGLPAQFKANDLIPGWTEALTLMREGDEWELAIPSNLAYGERGAGDGLIPPNQTLVFDLELLKVEPPPPNQPGADDSDNGGGQ